MRTFPVALATLSVLLAACGDPVDSTTLAATDGTATAAASEDTGAAAASTSTGADPTAAPTSTGLAGDTTSSTAGETTGAPVGPGCDAHVGFAALESTILANCSGYMACHEKGPFGGQLDLTPANAYASLVGVPSAIAPAVLRVAPGDSANSLLYRKLVDELADDDSEGGPMPKNGLATMWSRLPDEQIEQVRCWIDEGAPAE